MIKLQEMTEFFVCNNKNYINRLKVVKGRLPRNSGECVIEKSKYQFLMGQLVICSARLMC